MTLRDRCDRRRRGLMAARMEWEDHWRDLADHVLPRRARWVTKERKGGKLNNRILDSTATQALKILQSGMQAGMTSPSRPWFRFTTVDKALRENAIVRAYLDDMQTTVRAALATSNVYNALHTGYGDRGLFGTSAMLIDEHPDMTINARTFMIGEYWLATNALGRVDTLMHREDMTVEQLVGRFVYKGDRYGTPDWGVVESSVKRMYDNGQYDETFEVHHLVTPRPHGERDPERKDGKNMPIRSVWWMDSAPKDVVLQEGGYQENPIIAPRWDVMGNDVYGQGPGMDALGDVKQLQHQTKRKAEAIDKKVRPPMKGPSSLRNSSNTFFPGSMTFYDGQTPEGLSPVYQVTASLTELQADMSETRERIQMAFYADLFRMIAMSDRRQITAREIDERHEEKLIGLGPVLERSQNEQDGPLLDRVVGILTRRKKLAPAPQDLIDETGQGHELEVDYISMLAQAQKAVATGNVERIVGFIGNLAGTKPDVLDKLDIDQTVDEYADMLGVPVSIIRSDDDVAKIRADRAQEMEQAKQMEAAATMAPVAKQGAEAARLLSETRTDQTSGSLLERIGLG